MTAFPLSKTGERRLAEAESAIERGLSTFWEVGGALMQIRDERLYRADFATFEDYCQQRWNMTRRRANQLVEAAQMGTMVPIENERQGRVLAPLKEDPTEVREVYAEAQRRGDTTAAGLASVVAERHPKVDNPAPGGGGAPATDDRPASSPPAPTPDEQFRDSLRTALNQALRLTTQFDNHTRNLAVFGTGRDIYLGELRSLSRWVTDALAAADEPRLKAVP